MSARDKSAPPPAPSLDEARAWLAEHRRLRDAADAAAARLREARAEAAAARQALEAEADPQGAAEARARRREALELLELREIVSAKAAAALARHEADAARVADEAERELALWAGEIASFYERVFGGLRDQVSALCARAVAFDMASRGRHDPAAMPGALRPGLVLSLRDPPPWPLAPPNTIAVGFAAGTLPPEETKASLVAAELRALIGAIRRIAQTAEAAQAGPERVA